MVGKGRRDTKTKARHKAPAPAAVPKKQLPGRLPARSKVIARSSVNGLYYPGESVP